MKGDTKRRKLDGLR